MGFLDIPQHTIRGPAQRRCCLLSLVASVFSSANRASSFHLLFFTQAAQAHCVLRRIALCTVFCITVHWWCSARLVPELIIETGEFGKTGGEIGVDNNQVKPTNSSQFCQTGPPRNPTFLLLFPPSAETRPSSAHLVSKPQALILSKGGHVRDQISEEIQI